MMVRYYAAKKYCRPAPTITGILSPSPRTTRSKAPRSPTTPASGTSTNEQRGSAARVAPGGKHAGAGHHFRFRRARRDASVLYLRSGYEPVLALFAGQPSQPQPERRPRVSATVFAHVHHWKEFGGLQMKGMQERPALNPRGDTGCIQAAFRTRERYRERDCSLHDVRVPARMGALHGQLARVRVPGRAAAAPRLKSRKPSAMLDFVA